MVKCGMKRCLFLGWLMALMATAPAQPGKFSLPAHFRDLGTVYTYQKSNWDGSHSSTIFLYVADSGRLESFKWSKGDERATLVTAFFDWTTATVKKFQNHQVFRDGSRRLVAELAVTEPRKVILQLADNRDSMTLASELWHSYDFDFASLGFAWRALKNKREAFSFHIADVAMVRQKPVFVNKGEVQVAFEGEEKTGGSSLLKYSINGPGLENRGGHIWVNASGFMIEKYRIDLPDEEGFVNGQLVLEKTGKFSPEQWQRFLAARMKENQ